MLTTIKIGLPSLFPNIPNPELEKEIAQIKGIEVFGSVLRKPVKEAGDIDLAIDRKLTKREKQIVQNLANKYQKPIEVWDRRLEEENGELWASVDIFWYNKKPTHAEHDLYDYEDWFAEARPPYS